MIKCPNCGSTAQVKIIEQFDRTKYSNHYHTVYKCECGCGTTFSYFDQRNQGYVRNGWQGYEYLKQKYAGAKYEKDI